MLHSSQRQQDGSLCLRDMGVQMAGGWPQPFWPPSHIIAACYGGALLGNLGVKVKAQLLAAAKPQKSDFGDLFNAL